MGWVCAIAFVGSLVFALVEMAWLSFSFGLYCLGCLMGLFK